MRKLSKSDQKLTSEEEEARLDWFANRPKSQHFAVGTDVVSNNRKGTIINERVYGNRVRKLVKWHDGGISSIWRPLCLCVNKGMVRTF